MLRYRARSSFVATILALALPAPALAANVHVQLEGAMSTSGGAPAPDGSYPMAFRLYAAPTGGEALFQELSLGVPAKGGHFTYQLGFDSKNPLDETLFTQGQAKWMGLQIATEPELPRVELMPVPYASRATLAGQALDLACSGCVKPGALAASAVGTDNLADGAVTTPKIAPGAVGAASVGFTYAASDTKGGDALNAQHAESATTADLATVTKALQCTGCVGSAELADGAVTKQKLAGTILTDLDLPAKSSLKNVAFTGAYSDLSGGPDLSPYAKLSDPNTWAGLQTLKGGADFAKTQALNFRYQTADSDPVTCDVAALGFVYFNTKTSGLMLCDGKTFKPIAFIAEFGSANNPGFTCKDILSKNPGAKTGAYWIKPTGAAFQVYCDMTMDGGGWTALAYAPAHAIGLGFSLSVDKGTPGDLTNGWTQMAAGKSVTAPWFSTFRGRYQYFEDQPGIPQAGKLFEVNVDYTSKGGDKSFNELTSGNMGTIWTVSTSEGVTCSSWYSLFNQYWNTLATGASGGKGGHPYCGFYNPGDPSEGYCSQAYAVSSCNRGGYGKFTWAWYFVR